MERLLPGRRRASYSCSENEDKSGMAATYRARHNNAVRQAWFACALSLSVLSAGCASLRGPNDADRLIQSRQLTMQGMTAAQAGREADAEALFQRAIQICDVDERPRVHHAKLLWSQSKYDLAIREMEEAVRLSAGEPSLRIQLGKMYLELNRLAQAHAQARRALAGSNSMAAWMLRANVLRRQNRMEDALAAYQRALSLAPGGSTPQLRVEAQLAIADIYREINRPHLALAILDRWIDQNPYSARNKVLHLRGLALRSLHRYREAAACLAKAAQGERNNAVLLYDLAEAQYQSGDLIGARLSTQQALRIAPRMAQAIDLQHKLSQQRARVAQTP